jgi:hypothetical protein
MVNEGLRLRFDCVQGPSVPVLFNNIFEVVLKRNNPNAFRVRGSRVIYFPSGPRATQPCALIEQAVEMERRRAALDKVLVNCRAFQKLKTDDVQLQCRNDCPEYQR